jgi:hypothetical protein
VHKPENVEGFKVTFGEVHIVLPEDMHYHWIFQVNAYTRFILTCLFIKQNANHEGMELARTGEPFMLLSELNTVRTSVSRRYLSCTRSILTEQVCVQAELLLGWKPNKPPWMTRRWERMFMLTSEKWRVPWRMIFKQTDFLNKRIKSKYARISYI